MSVFFKYGKISVKEYKNLCPDDLIYLKHGDHILDLDRDVLYHIDEPEDPINMNKIGKNPFYHSIKAKFGGYRKLPLRLDQDGIFVRTDDVIAYSNIETLFYNKRRSKIK